jgi:hypothetical protein
VKESQIRDITVVLEPLACQPVDKFSDCMQLNQRDLRALEREKKRFEATQIEISVGIGRRGKKPDSRS